MPPFPAFLANTSSPSSSPPPTPQTPEIQFNPLNQNQWGPDSIGTLVFGFVMFFLGIVALWQGRQMRILRREAGTLGFAHPNPFSLLNYGPC